LSQEKRKRTVSTEAQEKIRISGFEKWLKQAEITHGQSFDYSSAIEDFKIQKNPVVRIFCKKHKNDYLVTPYNHIRFKGGGCKFCDEEQASSYFLSREFKKFNEFFKKNLAHRLEVKSEFQGMTSEIELYCKKHGVSERHKPTYLVNNLGYGCTQCSKEKTSLNNRLNIQKIKEEFDYLLPDNINILSCDFDDISRSTKIKASCDIHGEYSTTKGYLKRSEHKCPSCGNESTGYAGNRLKKLFEAKEKGRPTYIGVMTIEVFGITSLKVGVTTRTLLDRYKWNLKKIHYSAQLYETDAYILENQIHRQFNAHHDLRILMAGMRNGKRWSGDTECYWQERLNEITSFAENYINEIKNIDYEYELSIFEIPKFFTRNVEREKNLSNESIQVLGVDPKTSEIVLEFKSISDASLAGYRNVSQIISGKSSRQISNGLRWFRKDSFHPSQVLPLKISQKGSPKKVICIDTGEEFSSISQAEATLKSRGVKVSGSHITSVCKGKRKVAGGYRWSYKY